MTQPWIRGGRERLERERDEAHRSYHDAFAALDRAANDALSASRAEVTDAAAALKDALARLATFESLLIQFLQQITPYVDTKLRVIQDAVGDASMTATAAQRIAAAAERALERARGPLTSDQTRTDSGPRTSDQTRTDPGPRTRDPGPDTASHPAGPDTASHPGRPDAASYVGFEDLFRGSSEDIRARQKDYLPLFAGARDVLDAGCGRGEFLLLLKEAGITARGVDLNPEMVELCRQAGLNVQQADAVDHLRGLADESLGGLFAAQVVEHLPPERLLTFLREAGRVLRPGAPIVLETINPTCWVAFFEAFIRDLTHAKPLHPDTLKFLVIANGFTAADVRYRSPIPESGRLRSVVASDTTGRVKELIEAFNLNMERLNDRLFTYLDYAIVARRS